MCFFIVYLLKIITNIIKANTIIVSTTNANKSKYIISNKTASIIVPPPFSQYRIVDQKWQPHLQLSFTMLITILYFLLRNKRIY